MTDISFRRLQVHQVAKQALEVALANRSYWRGTLNIAEGAGRWSAADQRRHYQIACGSATEAAACVEIAMMFGAPATICEEIDSLLCRVVQMLGAMIRRR